MVTIVIASTLSLMVQNTLPITISCAAEIIFLTYCTTKLVLKFNVPTIPEPILRSDWEDFAEQVWLSQKDVTANRSFLMGWFYDAPFERLREEDAIAYLAWMKHGVPYEHGMLSAKELYKLESFDLPLLTKHVNNGKALPKRQSHENPLPAIRFNVEPLRFRHKPLIFYGVTHGIHFALHLILKKSGFTFVPAADPKKDIGYWYRLPRNEKLDMDTPLVFAHGVGGLAFCYKLIDDLLDHDAFNKQTPVILLDLPHVSLRMYDHIPDVLPQVESISKIIDDVVSHRMRKDNKPYESKATFIGHSYGTFLISWMVQKYPEKVEGCVFLGELFFQRPVRPNCFYQSNMFLKARFNYYNIAFFCK